jgi:sigma-E factor negative regulatory protein RseB
VIKLRVAAALTGLGAVVMCPQVHALVPPEPGSSTPAAEPAAPALGLLRAAVRVARERPWSGTQHVVSMVGGTPTVTDVRVEHVPSAESSPEASGLLDDTLLEALSGNYDLRIAAVTTCRGRPARVVEARRPGVVGAAAVAGRFWLDASTGLLLRRDVLQPDGTLLRSSELADVDVGRAAGVTLSASNTLRPAGERLDDAALYSLQKQGWLTPAMLPGGLVLFESRLLEGDVLQLSYTDGLSTLSLFGQRGEVPPTTSGLVRTVGGGTVWESWGEPSRVVWSEHGRTWTLVSDAAPSLIDDVLLVLPHSQAQVRQDGVGPRVWRGMSRVGAWLNPFD